MPQKIVIVRSRKSSPVKRIVKRRRSPHVQGRRKSKSIKLRSMSPVRIKIKHSGDLTKYGYHAASPAKQRRLALTKFMKSTGINPIRKVNALCVFNKNKKTSTAYKAFCSDKKWIMKQGPLLTSTLLYSKERSKCS